MLTRSANVLKSLAGRAPEAIQATARPARKRATFRTVNLNIKNNPPLPKAKLMHDVRRAAESGDVIGWNEIAPDSYFAAIRALGKGWSHYMPKPDVVQTPISWRNSVFKKVGAGNIKTHDGLPGVSPNRYVTWVKLKHRATGETVVRMNTHTVAGAFSPKKQSHREWRKEAWQTHMAKLKTLVKHFTDKGAVVIIGGDFNRNHQRVMGNSVAYDNSLREGTRGHATLDYVMHARDKSIQTLDGRVKRDFFSDHDAVVVRYRLTGR